MPTGAFPIVGAFAGKVATNEGALRTGNPEGRWVLSSSEIGVTVTAPHEVRSVIVNANLQHTSAGSMTSAEYGVLPTSKDPTTIAIQATWRARHKDDDIRGAEAGLQKLFAHEVSLNRRPLVQFRWAHLMLDEAYVTVARIAWTDGTFATGLPRAFTASITVGKARPKVLDRTTRFVPETKHRRIGHGETLEMLAWEEYGDPDLGIVLRRFNTHLPVGGETPGAVVRIPDRTHPALAEPIEPRSPAFLGNVAPILQAMAEERLGRRGPGYDALVVELGLEP